MTDYPCDVFIAVGPPDARGRHWPQFNRWTELAACDVRPGDWIIVTERTTAGRSETRWALVSYVTNEWSEVRVGDRVCGYPRLESVPAVPGKWGRPKRAAAALPALTYSHEGDQ